MKKNHIMLDAGSARVLALLQADAPELLAGFLDASRDHVFVSPAVAALMTGRSERAIREAFTPRRPGRVGKVKRYVSIAAVGRWSGTRIGVAEFAAMLDKLRSECSRVEWVLARPGPGSTIEEFVAYDNEEPPPGRGKASLLAACHRRIAEIDEDITSYEGGRP